MGFLGAKRLFIPHKDKKDEHYRTDMQTVENYVNGLSTGGSGVTRITIGTTGSHGKQIVITPTPTGTGHVVLSIPETLDITHLETGTIQPAGGTTDLVISGATVTIKGSTELYLAGVIKLRQTATGATGSISTDVGFTKYTGATKLSTFEEVRSYDTWRSATCTRSGTTTAVAIFYLGSAATYAMAGGDFAVNTVIVGPVFVPAGVHMSLALTNAAFSSGRVMKAG